MSFARKVWHLIVAVKDGLSLVFLLLFFFALYAILTARPNAAAVRDGALLLSLDGTVVEEKAEIDPIALLMSGQKPAGEYDVQELVHAINAAATDDRIKAVVLDMGATFGAGQVHLEDIASALDKVRAAKKPVLSYATVYNDDAIMLASHASEVWLDPMGGAIILGPGGNRLYYGELLNQLDVNARVYKVGTYKSAVEPYTLDGMSDPARENYTQVYGSLWSEWQAHVKKARPQANLAAFAQDPVAFFTRARGDAATAAKEAGLVDRLGDRVQFGNRVAEIAGEDPWDDKPGKFAFTDLDPWIDENPMPDEGDAIGVVTIAGEIVDGDAGPGVAGGTRIADILDDALDFAQIVEAGTGAAAPDNRDAPGNGLPEGCRVRVPAQAVNQMAVPGRVQNIPHLRFPQLAVLVGLGIDVVRVHLDRQIFPGIDELHQNGQAGFPGVAGAQVFRVSPKNFRQALALKFSAECETGAVRMGGTLPGLRQRVHIDGFFKIVIQPAAAPEVILAGGAEQNRRVCHISPAPEGISACR